MLTDMVVPHELWKKYKIDAADAVQLEGSECLEIRLQVGSISQGRRFLFFFLLVGALSSSEEPAREE